VTAETSDPVNAEWDALADRTSAPPWFRPGWFAAWSEAFGTGSLHAVATRENGRLTGIVPLGRRLGGLHSQSNWHTPEFGLLAGTEDLAGLARALFDERPRYVSMGFLNVDGDSFAAISDAAATAGYRVLVRTLELSPYVMVDGDWDAYEARTTAKLRSEIRRRRRKLEAEAPLKLEVVDGSERLDELLDEGFAVEGAGWKGQRGSAIQSQLATMRFYRRIARWASERGWLRLAFLRLGGRPLAFDLCMEQDGIHYLLKTGYDPAFRAFGPGMLLRHEMLVRAFASGLRSYEFLGANEPWKLEWATMVRRRVLLQAFRRSPGGLAEWSAYAYGRPISKKVLSRLGK
jgi:CelD/BcsL family acetyltransferase involved in cellulose biosynthesis